MQATGVDHLLVGLGPGMLDRSNLGFSRVIQLRYFRFPISTEHNIGSPTRHIGGDSDGARASGIGDNQCLALVLLSVKNIVFNLLFGQQLRDHFRHLDRGSTHQHRLLTRLAIAYIFDDGVKLILHSQIDQIIMIGPLHRLIGGYNDHVEAIDLVQFKGFGIGGAGHPRQFAVDAKIVLESSGSQGLAFILDINALFGFDRLVQTFRPAASRHGATGMLIDDDDLVILDDVIHIFGIEHTSA